MLTLREFLQLTPKNQIKFYGTNIKPIKWIELSSQWMKDLKSSIDAKNIYYITDYEDEQFFDAYSNIISNLDEI